MIRISTLFVLFCLTLVSQNTFAQSCDISYTNPNPIPGFGMSLDVDPINGFTSTNSTIFNSFPKNKVTTVTSPEYFYLSDQATIYFRYSLNIAVAGTTTTSPQIRITYGAGQSFSCTAPTPFTIVNGTNDLFFSITPSTAFAANTNFRIELTMDIDNADKAISALTLSSNALIAGVQSPLPVRFSLFNEKKVSTGVAVLWNVDMEQNVKVYEVQRSADGKNFNTIGSVDAIAQRAYSFTDTKAINNAYYRIKSVDADGKFMYSTIVNIKGDKSTVVVRAYPMPVQNMMTIDHPAATTNSTITIVSADGRMVQSILLTAGAQQTAIDLKTAQPGLYFARLDIGGEIATIKIVKN
jgi:hypothetical protein